MKENPYAIDKTKEPPGSGPAYFKYRNHPRAAWAIAWALVNAGGQVRR